MFIMLHTLSDFKVPPEKMSPEERQRVIDSAHIPRSMKKVVTPIQFVPGDILGWLI
jgi:hypothetical protein